MKRNLIFCYILVAATAVTATEYCDKSCTFNGKEIKHIACGNNGEFGPDCPKSVTLMPMEKSLQNLFVDKVNGLRNLIAGGANSTYKPACRMATIQWDEDMAENAALEAKQCSVDGKNTNYCHGTDLFPISGQIFYKPEYALDVPHDKMIEFTVEDWTLYIVTNRDESAIVADSTTRMGCAIVLGIPEGASSYTAWTVCNFANDSKGRKECKTAAEDCKNKPIDAYPNLCAVGENYEN